MQNKKENFQLLDEAVVITLVLLFDGWTFFLPNSRGPCSSKSPGAFSEGPVPQGKQKMKQWRSPIWWWIMLSINIYFSQKKNLHFVWKILDTYKQHYILRSGFFSFCVETKIVMWRVFFSPIKMEHAHGMNLWLCFSIVLFCWKKKIRNIYIIRDNSSWLLNMALS